MKRIVDERPESPEAAFLRAAGGARPPSRARKRALASVALAAGTLTTGTAAATSVASLGWLKGLVGLAVVGLGLSAGLAIHARDGAPEATIVAPSKAPLRTTRIAPTPAPPTPAATEAPEAPTPTPTKPREIPREPLATPSTAKEEPAPTTVTEPTAPTKPSALADEIARIQQARTATNAGRGAEALATLDAYAAAHPRGKLRQEADVLRIRALVVAGRRSEAVTKLEAFRAAYPTSPHTAPLEALLGK